MEKFEIAKYGMMQVVAIVYGGLALGATVKLNKSWLDQGYSMPDAYYRAIYYREYGFWLLGWVLLWAVAVSYLSSPLSKWELDGRYLSISGLALALLFAIFGTCIAFGGASPPPHLTTQTALP